MMRPRYIRSTLVSALLAITIQSAGLLVVFVWHPQAKAAPASDWHLTGYLSTTLPSDLSIRATLEGPYRLRLSSSLGFLPGPYVQLTNSILVGADAYNQATADLIEAALGYGLVWRFRLGWRPFKRAGFFFEIGYQLAALGGGASGEALIASATGTLPPQTNSGRNYDMNATVHMLDIEIGWRTSLYSDRLYFLVSIGYAGVLTASTRVEPTFQSLLPNATAAFARSSELYLDDVLETYVHTPTITVAIGYRLF
jgi:hypothetical protein